MLTGFLFLTLIKSISNIREIVVLCVSRLGSFLVKSLPAIDRLSPDLRGTLPTGDLCHHRGNTVAIRRFKLLQALSETLAPDLRVADFGTDMLTRMLRHAKLRTG